MDNLKKFISQNKDEFDIHEPSFNHFEKFKDKMLNGNNHNINYKNIIASIISVAALYFLFFWIAPDNFVIHTENRPSKEYFETENYYRNSLNKKMKVYTQLSGKAEADKSVLNELNDLNEEYEVLEQELNQSDNDQRIISAMVNNYRLRINLLDEVISVLKRYNF